MTYIDIAEVAETLGCSVRTVRRRVRAARQGRSSFVLPIHGEGNKGLWRLSDVLNWRESSPETPIVETPNSLKKRQKMAQAGLARLGLNSTKKR